MSEFNNSNIPILSGSNGHKAKAGGFQPMLLMRSVDEDGTVEPQTRRMQTVMTEHGPQVVEQAVLGRSQYVTAEDLVEMIMERTGILYSDVVDRIDSLEKRLYMDGKVD